jgi:hypothetical protein
MPLETPPASDRRERSKRASGFSVYALFMLGGMK